GVGTIERCSGTAARPIRSHDRAHDGDDQQHAEQRRRQAAREVDAAWDREREGEYENGDEDSHQLPRKAASPPAVEGKPQATRTLLRRFAHRIPGRSFSEAIVGIPSGGGSAAWAVQMTARIPTDRGPS